MDTLGKLVEIVAGVPEQGNQVPQFRIFRLYYNPSMIILRTNADKFVVPNCSVFCWIACNSSGGMRMVFTILRSAGRLLGHLFYSPKFSANFFLAGFAV